MELKLETIGREVIKPSAPAPLERLQLSIFDLTCSAIYVPTTFFYKSDTGESPEIISQRLKTSLSETLSRFYPLAGRIDGITINCNDEGVVFSEARTDLLLTDYLKSLNTDSLEEFFPQLEDGESPGTWPLLRVNVSFFGSGSGFAVHVGISHKICDAASLLHFLQGWAATSKRQSNEEVVTINPTFAGATIYPPPQSSFQPSTMDDILLCGVKCVTKRLLFESSKIADLKRKAASVIVSVPTRVEVITSLIWSCATNASRSNSSTPKSTIMVQSMDLRLRIPSNVLAHDAIGNLQTIFVIKKGVESTMQISDIVAEFRKAKEGVNKMIKDTQQGDNTASTITTTKLGYNLLNAMGNFRSGSKLDLDLYPMTSWCKKPFYEVDFGWGIPVWMGPSAYIDSKNNVGVHLMDSKDGEDVEAWVTLPEQVMPVFVRDQNLLTYAVLNPPIMI